MKKFRDKFTGIVYEPASKWVEENYAKSDRFEVVKSKAKPKQTKKAEPTK